MGNCATAHPQVRQRKRRLSSVKGDMSPDAMFPIHSTYDECVVDEKCGGQKQTSSHARLVRLIIS